MDRLEWLGHHPSIWVQYPSYQYLQEFIWDVQVVNDAAKWAVIDVQDFAQMTGDPAHGDDIILVALDHRGIVERLRKDNLDHG